MIYETGFTCGSFDLLHPGHLAMLAWCKGRCTKLIVGLQLDPSIDRPHKNKPVQSIVERTMQLRATKYVDEVIVYTTEAELRHLLSLLDVDVRFVGEEYKQQTFTGKHLCKRRGINVEFNPRPHPFSSTELRERVRDQDNAETIQLLLSLRPQYGTVGSRDVDVTARRKEIDDMVAKLGYKETVREDEGE